MRHLALFALAALLVASPAMAQDAAAAAPAAPMSGHAHAMGPGMAGGTGCGAGGCPCMAMMAKMDSANAQIAQLTEAMNKATGSKKTEAMAAVVNALVQDRLAMQSMMHQMHSHMEMMGSMGGKSGCSAGMECCKGQAMDCCKGGSSSCSAPAAAPEKKE